MDRIVGLYINGKWETPKGRERVKRENPANTDEIVSEYVDGGREDVGRAIGAAKKAFPGWAATPAPARGRILARAAAIASGRAKELGELLCREEGKLATEGTGEVMKGINLLEWYSGEGFRHGGKTVPSESPNNLLYTIRVPLGVVGIITPWNFPWAIPVWKIAPALVAGNTVVFKPAGPTPAMAQAFVQILEEAGLPPGVVNMVTGPGSVIGPEICASSDIKAVSFTGSNAVGMGVLEAASRRLVRSTLEMGGKNPLVVMDDANLDLAVAGTLNGAYGSTGQRCTATSRLILHKPIKEKFLEKLVEGVQKIKLGNGLDKETGMGPVVDAKAWKGVRGFLDRARKEKKAKVLCGGGVPPEKALAKGYFIEPTVIDGVTQDMEIWREEVFGPVLAVAEARDFDHALELANDSQYGLTSAFYSENGNLCMRYVERIESGMVHVNSPTVGGEAQAPFGGMKATGFGEREMSEEGIRFFTTQKTVWIDYAGKPRTSKIY